MPSPHSSIGTLSHTPRFLNVSLSIFLAAFTSSLITTSPEVASYHSSSSYSLHALLMNSHTSSLNFASDSLTRAAPISLATSKRLMPTPYHWFLLSSALSSALVPIFLMNSSHSPRLLSTSFYISFPVLIFFSRRSSLCPCSPSPIPASWCYSL